MYKQWQHYRDSISCNRGETKKIDLPKSGILSFIYLEITANQAAGAPYYNSAEGVFRLINQFSSIVIRADGRTDIVSLPGTVCNYVGFLDQGITMYEKIREYSAASQTSRVVLNFGRKMWDGKFALDLQSFDNVELQLVNAATSTYWASTYSLDVWLGFLRGTGIPDGRTFFRKEKWREYTTAQNGREYLDIPTGLPVRRIICQANPAYDSTTGVVKTKPADLFHETKLTAKSGAEELFNGNWFDLAHVNLLELGYETIVQGASYHAADKGFDIGLGDVRGFAAISGARDGAVSAVIPTREGDLSHPTQKLEAREADSPVDYIARGAAYENCVLFSFGDEENPNTLLNPAMGAMGQVELEVLTRDSANAADGTNRVILDRLVTTRQITA